MEKATSTISSRTPRSKEHTLLCRKPEQRFWARGTAKPAFGMQQWAEGQCLPWAKPWTAGAQGQHGEEPSGFDTSSCPSLVTQRAAKRALRH